MGEHEIHIQLHSEPSNTTNNHHPPTNHSNNHTPPLYPNIPIDSTPTPPENMNPCCYISPILTTTLITNTNNMGILNDTIIMDYQHPQSQSQPSTTTTTTTTTTNLQLTELLRRKIAIYEKLTQNIQTSTSYYNIRPQPLVCMKDSSNDPFSNATSPTLLSNIHPSRAFKNIMYELKDEAQSISKVNLTSFRNNTQLIEYQSTVRRLCSKITNAWNHLQNEVRSSNYSIEEEEHLLQELIAAKLQCAYLSQEIDEQRHQHRKQTASSIELNYLNSPIALEENKEPLILKPVPKEFFGSDNEGDEDFWV